MTSTPVNGSNKPPSVASIVRDNYTTNQNRELITDKATLIASLNNTNGSATNHYYQNIQQFKPPQNEVKKSPLNVVSANGSSATTTTTTTSNGVVTQAVKNAPSTPTASKTRALDGYVGFANLPNQVYRKSVKKGFEFNLMVIGESGLGKSTFINSLFLTELYSPAEFPGTFERRKRTAFVDATSVMLAEKGVNLKLTIVDTPGFGDSIDNSNCWSPIVEHIENKYEEYLNAESKVNRKLPICDQRIHCCLHFISPGHT